MKSLHLKRQPQAIRNFTICIGSTPTFLYLYLYLNTAYAAHYVYFTNLCLFKHKSYILFHQFMISFFFSSYIQFLATLPKSYSKKVIIITCEEDRKLCPRLSTGHAYNSELLLTGILRQQLDLDQYPYFIFVEFHFYFYDY